MYRELTQATLAALLVLIVELKQYMITENRSRLLLTTRDGCLLEILCRYIRPHLTIPFEVHRFHSSRYVNSHPSEEYERYIREMYDNKSLIFDLHGSFRSGRELYKRLFNGSLPRVHIFSSAFDAVDYDGLTFSIRHYGTDSTIERRNPDVVGQLLQVYFDENTNKRVFLRAPLIDYTLKTAQFVQER